MNWVSILTRYANDFCATFSSDLPVNLLPALLITIYIRTGVFQGENDPEDTADYVVDDFYEAAELIMKLEGISDRIG